MVNPNKTPNFKELSSFGFSVFILPRGQKEAARPWKEFQSRKPNEDELAGWQGVEANAAVVTGRVSNLIVMDVDSAEAQALVDDLNMPRTPTVKTPNGRHYYFEHPAREIRNAVKVKGVKLDVRGEGGYVVAPGSRHPSGGLYEWEVSPKDCGLAQLPEEILEIIAPKAPAKSLTKQSASGSFIEADVFSVWFNSELSEKIDELRETTEGRRNDTLFRLAVGLANHVAALELDWGLVEEILRPEALAIGLTRNETDRTLTSAWETGSKTPTEWLQIAQNWIYVASRDRFWSPTAKRELSPRAFSMNFAEAKPFAKGSLATILTEGGLVERVLDFSFRPSMPSGVFTEGGDQFYNTYQSPKVSAEEGDWTPFAEFCEYLIPNTEERDHLLRMMAWTIANPGQKLSYALLLQSKEHGVGKSTLVDIWRHLLGYENTRLTSSDEMDSGYQSYLADKLLVVLEELNLGSGITAYNRLKAMITADTANINEKYLKQREARNYANFVFLSNLDAPIFIEQNDRRFYVLNTPATRRPPEYWTEFHEWWRANLGVVKAFFEQIDLSDFQPKAFPPMTPAKAALKKQSATPLAQAVEELIEEQSWPISRGVCTLAEMRTALAGLGIRERSSRKISSTLSELGCVALGQTRLSDGSRISPWAILDINRWRNATAKQIRAAFENPCSGLSTLQNVAA